MEPAPQSPASSLSLSKVSISSKKRPGDEPEGPDTKRRPAEEVEESEIIDLTQYTELSTKPSGPVNENGVVDLSDDDVSAEQSDEDDLAIMEADGSFQIVKPNMAVESESDDGVIEIVEPSKPGSLKSRRSFALDEILSEDNVSMKTVEAVNPAKPTTKALAKPVESSKESRESDVPAKGKSMPKTKPLELANPASRNSEDDRESLEASAPVKSMPKTSAKPVQLAKPKNLAKPPTRSRPAMTVDNESLSSSEPAKPITRPAVMSDENDSPIVPRLPLFDNPDSLVKFHFEKPAKPTISPRSVTMSDDSESLESFEMVKNTTRSRPTVMSDETESHESFEFAKPALTRKHKTSPEATTVESDDESHVSEEVEENYHEGDSRDENASKRHNDGFHTNPQSIHRERMDMSKEFSKLIDAFHPPKEFQPNPETTAYINEREKARWYREQGTPAMIKLKRQRDFLLYALRTKKEELKTMNRREVKKALEIQIRADGIHRMDWWSNALLFSLYVEGENAATKVVNEIITIPPAVLVRIRDSFLNLLTASKPTDALDSDANYYLNRYDLFLLISLKYRAAILSFNAKCPTWKDFKKVARRPIIDKKRDWPWVFPKDKPIVIQDRARDLVAAYLSIYGDLVHIKSLVAALHTLKQGLSQDGYIRATYAIGLQPNVLPKIIARTYALVCFRLLHHSRYYIERYHGPNERQSEGHAKYFADQARTVICAMQEHEKHREDFRLPYSKRKDEMGTVMDQMKPVLERALHNMDDGKDVADFLPFYEREIDTWRSEAIRLLTNRKDKSNANKAPTVFEANFRMLIEWMKEESKENELDMEIL